MCSCLGKFYFNLVLVLVVAPVLLVCQINMWIACCCPGCLEGVYRVNKKIIGFGFQLTNLLSCCVLGRRIKVDEMNASLSASPGKPRLVILNHLSFMDTILISSLISLRNISEVKMLAAEHLFNMPFIGLLVKSAGHLKVPFKTQATKKTGDEEGSVADFSVDKDQIQKVMDQFDNWVRDGHIGSWFPEGRMNPNPPVLQQFRAGGFALAVHTDCEIWCAVSAGLEVFWPRKSAVGGSPANVSLEAFCLCKSSHALIEELSAGKTDVDDKQRGILIANHAQHLMQERRDKIVAEGWVSVDNSPPEPEKKTKEPEKDMEMPLKSAEV